MDLRLAIALVLLGVFVAVRESEAGGFGNHHKKIIIHVPVKNKQQKHVHTIVKHIHHHHKPIVIKEEKIIKHEVKPIIQERHFNHEHLHHHHQYEHPVEEEPKGEIYVPEVPNQEHYEHDHHEEEIEHEH